MGSTGGGKETYPKDSSAASKAIYNRSMNSTSPNRKLTKGSPGLRPDMSTPTPFSPEIATGGPQSTTVFARNAAEGNGKAPNVGSVGINTMVMTELMNEEKHKLCQLKREERAQLFGLDCVDTIVINDWEVGREVQKTFSIKNISLIPQRLNYDLPK